MKYSTILLCLALLRGGVAVASAPKPAARTNPIAASLPQFQRLMSDGASAMVRGDYTAAVSAFDKATRINSGSSEAFFQLGEAFFQRAFEKTSDTQAGFDDANLAIGAYQTATALDPDFKRISDPYRLHHGTAMCYEKLARHQDALAELRQAMAASPGNPMPSLYAAQIRLRMKDAALSAVSLEVAIQHARKLKSYPALAKFLRTDATFSDLMSSPQNQALLKAHDELDARKPAQPLAGTLAMGQTGARDSLRDTLTPVSPSQARRAALQKPMEDSVVLDYLDRGHEDFRFRRYTNAIGEYHAALAADAHKGTLSVVQKSMLFENLGASYRKLGQLPEATKALERSVDILPQNASALYQLALAYSVTGHFSRALEALDQSLRNARTTAELRQLLLFAKTDGELDPLRPLPAFKKALEPNLARLRTGR